MLNKAINKAHIQDRQAQKCLKKGLFDSAIKLEKNILKDLDEALKDSSNSLAVESILSQRTRHAATLNRLQKGVQLRDRARRCAVNVEINYSDMSEIPEFGGKSAPVLSASSSLPCNTSEKDRMILRLQDKIAILSSQLDEARSENTLLRQKLLELERSQSLCSTTQLLSPHSSTYHHITPSVSSELTEPRPPPEDNFTLTPLEKPLVNYKW